MENNLYKTLYKNLISYLENESKKYEGTYNHYKRVLDEANRQREELVNKDKKQETHVDSGDYMSYEMYKQYLYTLPLSSQEYEAHIQDYCRKHKI